MLKPNLDMKANPMQYPKQWDNYISKIVEEKGFYNCSLTNR
ncbi:MULTISPECIES: hypothetical protein [Clostridium]|nr:MULTISPECIES: hypothetical protein [Clostridium]